MHTKRQAKLAYDNYKQDCLIKQRYGISYESYMNNVILSLIDVQYNLENNMTDTPDKTLTQKNQNNVSEVDISHCTHVNAMSDKKCHTHLHKDINYPSKVRGYIAMQPTKFKFIGPDRPPIDTGNSNQYLKFAKTIRESGAQNYRQVRVAIKSGVNIEAWRRQLYDYKDQVLLQYGFPLSIKDSRPLIEQNIKIYITFQQHNITMPFPHIWLKRDNLGPLWALFQKLRIMLYTAHHN